MAGARRNLGAGSWLEAETMARAALAREPNEPAAYLILGLAIAAMGEADRAATVLDMLAAMQPDAPHPCGELANLLPPMPAALIRRQFRACLLLSPGDTRLRLGFADYLLDDDRAAEAEAVLTDPRTCKTVAVRHLAGLAQAEQGRFGAAIVSFSGAVALDPTAAASWSNLGTVCKVEDRFEAAIEAHDRAAALAPDNPRFRVNRAVTLLKAGEWARAWLDYEWRLKLSGAPDFDLDRLLPSLAELPDLTGRTVIAAHEEGFGDTMQFLRYLPLLARRGARVVACVPPALRGVMALVPGVAEVIVDAGNLPPHDFICPFFSLPRVFATTIGSIPPPPRLRVDPALAGRWSDILPRGGVRAGLVWAGQSRPWLPGFRTLDRRRSAGLAAFAPFADVPGVTWISLQMGDAARQQPPHGMALFDPMPQVADFADTAAIIAALDVVISVDTSVVHLAGLLGKPVFLLDRYDGCWRWLSGRPDSPWYPHLTIFRQEAPDDWLAPMQRAAASLHAMALFRGTAGRSAAEGISPTIAAGLATIA